MLLRNLALLILGLFMVGCRGGATNKTPPPSTKKTESLPPEVSGSPEDAVKHYQKKRTR